MDVRKAMDLIAKPIFLLLPMVARSHMTRKRTPCWDVAPGWLLEHLLHVCDVAKAMATMPSVPLSPEQEDYLRKREKLMRWVGFAQGAAWALGMFSVDELREQCQ